MESTPVIVFSVSNPYVFAAVDDIEEFMTDQYIRIFNIFTGEVVREIIFYGCAWSFRVNPMFCSIVSIDPSGEG